MPMNGFSYTSDGSGRDSYVNIDLGGNLKNSKQRIPQPGGRQSALGTNDLKQVSILSTPKRYFANGTGRDGYATWQTNKEFDFKGHLRNHPPMLSSGMDVTHEHECSSPENRRLVSRQKAQSSRLAELPHKPQSGSPVGNFTSFRAQNCSGFPMSPQRRSVSNVLAYSSRSMYREEESSPLRRSLGTTKPQPMRYSETLKSIKGTRPTFQTKSFNNGSNNKWRGTI